MSLLVVDAGADVNKNGVGNGKWDAEWTFCRQSAESH